MTFFSFAGGGRDGLIAGSARVAFGYARRGWQAAPRSCVFWELVRAAPTTTVVTATRCTQNFDRPLGRAGTHRAPTDAGPLAQLLSEVLVVRLSVPMSMSIASSAAASGSGSRWT